MNVAFIGFGEASQAIVKGWQSANLDISNINICAYDIKTDDPATSKSKQADYEALKVTGHATLTDAVSNADYVLSAVTASQAHTVAKQAASKLKQGALFFDLNSCAPQTKQASAELLHSGLGLYVDTAVMTPIYPDMHRSAMSLCGPHAKAGISWMESMNMVPTFVEGDVGAASMIKMVRSIMIKGVEALTTEFVLTAVEAGVEDQVINSLGSHFPGLDWTKFSAYLMERVATHGVRRAEEMEEVCLTIEGLGLEPMITNGTVKRQRQIGEMKLGMPADEGSYTQWAKLLLAGLEREKNA
ncbi:MAG: DUF1932 domain-containing protein [Alphaproteobacteria bacterium]